MSGRAAPGKTPTPARSRARTVLIATCWVPAATWYLTSVYLRQYDGWGAWAAAPLLLPALCLSIGLGVAGFVGVALSYRRTAQVDVPLFAASLTASSVILYLVARNAFG